MRNFLFPRLTATSARGAMAFAAVTAMARNPDYYREGGIADTLDGRFAMLATMTALTLVRLEGEGTQGQALSVALTERFVETLDAEHRELGMSDPTIGKTVRKLVGALARRVELWRDAATDATPWDQAVRQSLFTGDAEESTIERSARLLSEDWRRIKATSLANLERGHIA